MSNDPPPPIDSLQDGPLTSQPIWYRCFERFVSTTNEHIISYDKGSKHPKQLVPLYILQEPPFFSHDPGFLLLAGLFGNKDIDPDITKSLLPSAVSTQPFSYRYGISHSKNATDELTDGHIEEMENQALKNRSKMVAFLFVDHSQKKLKETLTKNGYESLPVGIRWELNSSSYQSFDEWLSTIGGKKRETIRRDLRKLKGTDVKIETWNTNQCMANKELFAELQHTHIKKYGNSEEDVKKAVDSMFEFIDTFQDQLVAFVASKDDQIVGYTICLQSNDELHIRYPAFLPNLDRIYFAATYYRPIQYAIEHKLDSIFGVGSDNVKRSRGLHPKILYVFFKPLDLSKSTIKKIVATNKKFQPSLEKYIKSVMP